MAITASGALSTSEGTGLTTLTVVTPILGCLRILTTGEEANIAVSTVSGGGVGTWSNAVINNDTVSPFRAEIWWGTVTSTSVAPTTITLTWASSIASTSNELISQMFAPGVTSSKWALDVASTSKSTSSTTVSFPTLAPTMGTELYWGYSGVAQTSAAGSTSGYTYTVTPTDVDLVCYNPAVTASTSPAGTQSPTGWFDAVGALFAVQTATAGEFFM